VHQPTEPKSNNTVVLQPLGDQAALAYCPDESAAERQTGIYTEARPGGWNLVGRTPLQLVSVADSYFPLRTGDRVRFEPIDTAEYQRLLGRRL
jgi:hypothetical protein